MGQIEERMKGTAKRLRKHKPCAPNDIYPKRKEIHVDFVNWTNQWNDPRFFNYLVALSLAYLENGKEFVRMVQYPQSFYEQHPPQNAENGQQ